MADPVLVYEDEDQNLWVYPRWFERFRKRFTRTADRPVGPAWEALQGYHMDAAGTITDPRLISLVWDAVNPVSVNGAYCIYRLNPGGSTFTEQRAYSASKGFVNVLVFQPFSGSNPGEPSDEAAVLADLTNNGIPLINEGEVAVFGNMNGANWMPEEENQATRATAWFALEAKAIKVFQDNGVLWGAHDDQGIVFLCTTIVERLAAWTTEGVTVANCEFLGVHCYIDAGFVPVLALLAQDSMDRAGVTIPLFYLEFAYGFLGQGFSRADKPWLLTDTPGTLAVTWTRLSMRWFRAQGIKYAIFESHMFFNSLVDFSSWGDEYVTDLKTRPLFIAPISGGPLTGTFDLEGAQNRAYSLRLSNGGTVEEATLAAQRVETLWFSR